MTDPLEFFPREHPYRKMREAAAAPAAPAPVDAVPDSEPPRGTSFLRDWAAPGYVAPPDVPRGTPFVISDIPAPDGGIYSVTVTCNKPMTRGGLRNALEFALRWFIDSDYLAKIPGS